MVLVVLLLLLLLLLVFIFVFFAAGLFWVRKLERCVLDTGSDVRFGNWEHVERYCWDRCSLPTWR
jgi:hypothetical protein